MRTMLHVKDASSAELKGHGWSPSLRSGSATVTLRGPSTTLTGCCEQLPFTKKTSTLCSYEPVRHTGRELSGGSIVFWFMVYSALSYPCDDKCRYMSLYGRQGRSAHCCMMDERGGAQRCMTCFVVLFHEVCSIRSEGVNSLLEIYECSRVCLGGNILTFPGSTYPVSGVGQVVWVDLVLTS